jgi:hypothetical protein
MQKKLIRTSIDNPAIVNILDNLQDRPGEVRCITALPKIVVSILQSVTNRADPREHQPTGERKAR